MTKIVNEMQLSLLTPLTFLNDFWQHVKAL
jgi:hypothetical protein